MPIRGLILALSCIMSVRALQLPSFLRSRLPKVLGGERWYSSGLKFECTGCGKCCKQDGMNVNLEAQDPITDDDISKR